MNRRIVSILVVFAGCVVLLAVMFYAGTGENQPDGLSATQRMQAERIMALTRKEIAIHEEKQDVLRELLESLKDASPDQRQEIDDQYSATTAQLTHARQLLSELEQAVADDSADAMEDVMTRLKSE